MSFKEWLKEREQPFRPKQIVEKEHVYYTIDMLIKDVNEHNRFIDIYDIGYTRGLSKKHNIDLIHLDIEMNEKIIEPDKIRINSTNLDKLNSEFNKYRIYFKEDTSLSGYYNKKDDELVIFIADNNSTIEIEAMLAHEMVHREQHKRAGENIFKFSEKLANNINKLISKKQNLIKEPAGILANRDEIKKIDTNLKELMLNFKNLNQFEEMAYACQAVKEYGKIYSKPNDIINYLLIENYPISSRFKKYIYLYWLIKDKI